MRLRLLPPLTVVAVCLLLAPRARPTTAPAVSSFPDLPIPASGELPTAEAAPIPWRCWRRASAATAPSCTGTAR